MGKSIRISAKALGSLALPDTCPRCFWLQMKVEGGLPYQIFPGIFNTIDSYGKRLVESWFARHGNPPPWLSSLGKITRSIKPPHHTKFNVVDGETSLLLSGTPDAVFLMKDGSHAIIDYKTAKFTATQDELFPMYEAQLNAYAYIGERCGFHPVSKLALVYTEPISTDASTQDDSNMTRQGFLMGFSAQILNVETKPTLVAKLLKQARRILDSHLAPAGAPGCEDCASLKELLALSAS
jgi:hypothetical protein